MTLKWTKVRHMPDGSTNEYVATDDAGNVVGHVIRSHSKWYPWRVYANDGGYDTASLANGKAIVEAKFAKDQP